MISTRIIDDTEYPILYYTLSNLFEAVKMHTSYRALSIENGLDTYAITDDEKDFFDEHIKTAVMEVFKTFSRLSQDITDAVQFQEEDLSSTSTIDESACVVFIYEKATYWDNNVDDLFDKKVKRAIVLYISKLWSKTKLLGNVNVLDEDDYEGTIKDIKGIINMRTTKPKITHRSF